MRNRFTNVYEKLVGSKKVVNTKKEGSLYPYFTLTVEKGVRNIGENYGGGHKLSETVLHPR